MFIPQFASLRRPQLHGEERNSLAAAASSIFAARMERLPAAAIIAIAIIAAAAIQSTTYLNHDVAWFVWGGDQMLRGAVLGRDILEPNFPLAYMIYWPAASLGQVVGFSLGAKVWILTLFALSAALTAGRVSKRLRLPILTALSVFVVIAFPREFGQREQIAFLLVLPYCIPASRGRAESIATGVLAGIGFAIKPHFLIALLFVEIGRKPLRAEQVALILTGAAYAAAILVFFQPFLFEMLPVTREVYWAFDRPERFAPFAIAAFSSASLFAAAHFSKNVVARTVSLAAVGFTVAAFAQQRLYDYQMLPAWGFILVGAIILFRHKERTIRLASYLILFNVFLWAGPQSAIGWLQKGQTDVTVRLLAAALERQPSFAVVAVHPFPAFPTAVETSARYVGSSNSHWFLPAVAQSFEKHEVARDRAITQAVRELSRRPAIVVVDTDWRRHTITHPSGDGLQFLLTDRKARRLWRPYRKTDRVGQFDIYSRR